MSMKSGIYIVELLNEEPIFTNEQDTRPGRQGTPVKKGNIKFGKAKDLDQRRRNYQRTFGEGNFYFEVMCITSQIDVIEKRIMREVDEYRMRGSSGRKLEWLERIEIQELKNIINKVKNRGSMNRDLVDILTIGIGTILLSLFLDNFIFGFISTISIFFIYKLIIKK